MSQQRCFQGSCTAKQEALLTSHSGIFHMYILMGYNMLWIVRIGNNSDPQFRSVSDHGERALTRRRHAVSAFECETNMLTLSSRGGYENGTTVSPITEARLYIDACFIARCVQPSSIRGHECCEQRMQSYVQACRCQVSSEAGQMYLNVNVEFADAKSEHVLPKTVSAAR